jgi:hypothetical protein
MAAHWGVHFCRSMWWFGASGVQFTLQVKYIVDTLPLSGGEWASEVLSRRLGWRLEGRSLAARLQTLVQRFSFFDVPRSTMLSPNSWYWRHYYYYFTRYYSASIMHFTLKFKTLIKDITMYINKML